MFQEEVVTLCMGKEHKQPRPRAVSRSCDLGQSRFVTWFILMKRIARSFLIAFALCAATALTWAGAKVAAGQYNVEDANAGKMGNAGVSADGAVIGYVDNPDTSHPPRCLSTILRHGTCEISEPRPLRPSVLGRAG